MANQTVYPYGPGGYRPADGWISNPQGYPGMFNYVSGTFSGNAGSGNLVVKL